MLVPKLWYMYTQLPFFRLSIQCDRPMMEWHEYYKSLVEYILIMFASLQPGDRDFFGSGCMHHGILYGLNGWGSYGKVSCCCFA